MTRPDDWQRRAAIRATWLRLSAQGPTIWRHLFPIGTLKSNNTLAIYDEQRIHSDLMLLTDVDDRYSNLAAKSIAAFDAAYRLMKFSYILKVDDDSFVRVGALLKALRDISHLRLYWGFLDGRARPKRAGVWHESDWMLCDRYLPYQLGGGYVLASSLVEYLSTNRRLFKLYRSEDVSVGAWLAGLDVHYVHDPRFNTEYRSRGCNNEYLITHKQSIDDLHRLYSDIVTSGKLCGNREYRLRASYVYDWSVPPSQCCTRANDTRIP